MRFFPLAYLSILLFFPSCKRDRNSNDIYRPENYFRVSTARDSTVNMYVIFKSKIYPNRLMYKFYWGNGNIQGISYFINGVNDGPWSTYFDNGSITFEGSFLNGKKNGIHKLYFPNGKISRIENYKMGTKVGVWQYYDSTGAISNTKNYSD